MFDLAQDWIDAQDARMRSEVRAAVLREVQEVISEKARQRSYRRRMAEYADHERALQLASTMEERHRVEAAGKIADVLELEGKHYEVRTVDRWLSRPDWKPPTAATPT
jgi:phosphopentomutase